MELFKTIGSALSFSNSDSKQSAKEASPKQQQQQTSGSVLGGPAGAGGSSSSPSSAVKANPFGAAFSDAGIAAARGSPKRKGSTGATTTSSKSAASPKKGSSSGSIGGGKAKSSSSASPKASKSSARGDDGNGEDQQRERSEEVDTLAGGVEKALNSFSRTISRSLSFKSNSSPKETSTDKKKTSAAAAPQVVPTGAATFSKFDVSPEEELAKKAAATASANASAEPRSQAAPGLPRARSVTFGTPATSLSTMKDFTAAATRARGTQQDPFDGQLPTALTAEQKEKLEREALTLQGTSRVKYHGTSVVQGNTIHFVVVAVVVGSSKAVDGGGKPQPNYSMALIGLLDPLGTVRASTKATVERCDAIRKLERVRISPREADLASLGAGGSASSSSGGAEKKAGSAGSVLLVDPAQASVLGVLVPFLRRVGGVSAVDGFKADYWTASDAAGTHRVPLFDVEGPIDDLNNIAVLRLRCHTLKVEDALPPGATRADVTTQTLNDAKALLHDDFEDELDSLRKDHRHEIDMLRHEVAKLQQQLDWKVSETKELTASSRAKEDAMTTEIAELKRQLSMRIVATQTDGLRRKATHRSEDDGRSNDTMSTSAATEEPESRSASTPPPHDASANHTNKNTFKKNTSAETNTTATLRTAATLETSDANQGDSRSAHQHNEPVPLTRDALYEIHHGSTRAGSGAAAQQGNPVNASKPRQHHHNNSIAVYEPIPRAADYSTAMGRERVPQAFGTASSTDHVRAWDTSLDSRSALASPHSKPVAADDPLAQVRAKLARSEAFLKQARTGGSSTAVPTTATVVGPGVVASRSTQLHHHASSSSPLEAFSSWEASAIHSTASIRSPAQIMRQSSATSTRDPGNTAAGVRRLY